MALKASAKLLLSIIGSAEYIKGKLRVQKYGFLLSRKLKDRPDIEFYDDWKPSKFGPFSTKLSTELGQLGDIGYIDGFQVQNEYKIMVIRYSTTHQSKKTVEEVKKNYPEIFKYINEIILTYNDKPAKLLLADIYSGYPEYTLFSEIKPQVRKEITQSLTYLSPEYEIPDEVAETLISKIRKRNRAIAQEELFEKLQKLKQVEKLPDYKARLKLAQTIGLEKHPDLDPYAIYRMAGSVGKKIRAKEVDSVELIRSVRGS